MIREGVCWIRGLLERGPVERGGIFGEGRLIEKGIY